MMWQANVVEYLQQCKAAGWEFDAAWGEALCRYPPRGPGMGRRQLTFEEAGEPTIVGFFKQACDDAWHGDHPELAHLTADLLDLRESPLFVR